MCHRFESCRRHHFCIYASQTDWLFLFSPPRITLKNRPTPCPGNYHPHPKRIKLLTCSDFSESTCACTADLSRRSFTKTEALCEGVSPPIFDTARNLLQINAYLLQYSLQFFPSRNPYQPRYKLQSFIDLKLFRS